VTFPLMIRFRMTSVRGRGRTAPNVEPRGITYGAACFPVTSACAMQIKIGFRLQSVNALRGIPAVGHGWTGGAIAGRRPGDGLG
jgi:hypothetical protein